MMGYTAHHGTSADGFRRDFEVRNDFTTGTHYLIDDQEVTEEEFRAAYIATFGREPFGGTLLPHPHEAEPTVLE